MGRYEVVEPEEVKKPKYEVVEPEETEAPQYEVVEPAALEPVYSIPKKPITIKPSLSKRPIGETGYWGDLPKTPEIKESPLQVSSMSYESPALEAELTPSPGSAAEFVQTLRKYRELQESPLVRSPYSPVRYAGEVFAGGMGTISGISGMAKRLGAETVGESIRKVSDAFVKQATPPDPNFADAVASGFGSMATFLIPGYGVQQGALKLAQVAPRLATWFGVGTSSILEAMVESGTTYNEGLEKGMTPEQADESASQVFWSNIPLLLITNRLGFFGDKGGALRKTLTTSFMEGSQEASQEIFSNMALYDPVIQDVITSAGVGAITGGGVALTMAKIEQRQAQRKRVEQEQALKESEMAILDKVIAPEPVKEIPVPPTPAEQAPKFEVIEPEKAPTIEPEGVRITPVEPEVRPALKIPQEAEKPPILPEVKDYPELQAPEAIAKAPTESEIILPQPKELTQTQRLKRAAGGQIGAIQFLRNLGGINPNLAESSDIRELGRIDLMNTKTGKSLDRAVESFIEVGYLPEGSTGSDLIALLDKEIKTGIKQLRQSDIGMEEPIKPMEEMTLEEVDIEIDRLNELLAFGKLSKSNQRYLSMLIGQKGRMLPEPEKEVTEISESIVGDLNLKEGDKLKIVENDEPHEVTVKKVNDNGDVTLQNDISKKVDVFDPLKVIEIERKREAKTESIKLGGIVQEQGLLPGTPAREMPEKGLEAKRAQVEQKQLLEGFKPETELTFDDHAKIKNIIRTAKSMAEAQTQLKKMGYEFTIAELKQSEIMLKGGESPDLTDKIVKTLIDNIKGKHPTAQADYGLGNLADIKPEDLIDSMSLMDIAKEKVLGMIEKIKHAMNSIELAQNYLYSFDDSKPIAEGVIDSFVKMLRNEHDLNVFNKTALQVDNPEALAGIVVKADRDNSVNIFSEFEKARKEGKLTQKDVNAFKKGIYYLHKFMKQQLISDILESRLGIRLKSNGMRYRVEYSKKDGGITQRWVSEYAIPNIQRKFKDFKVLEQKEEVIFKRRALETGEYKSETMMVKDYNEALAKLKADEKKLVNELLPYRNYIPHNRKGGNYWVEVFEPLAQGGEEKVYSARVPTETYARAMEKKVKEIPEFKGFRVKISPHSEKMKIMPSFGTMADVQVFMHQNGIDPESETAQRIINAYRAMSPLMSHLIHAQNIAGYRVDWTGIVEGMYTGARSAAGRAYRSDIKDLRDLLKSIKDDFRYNTAFKYLNALSSTHERNEIFDAVRGLTYFTLLANKPTYIIQNLLEPVWALSRMEKLKNPLRFMMPLGKEYGALIRKAESQGMINPFLFYETEGKGMLERLNILGMWSEQMSSRKTFEIGLRVARDKNLAGDEAYKFAYQFLFNVGKPFYNQANKPIFTLGEGWKSVRQYGFTLMNWMLDFYGKFGRGSVLVKMKTVLAWIVLAGVGSLPWGRKLLEKLEIVDLKKDPKDMTLFERFMLGGFAGAFGFDSRFLIPLLYKGTEQIGSVVRSVNILAEKTQRAIRDYNKYGIWGVAGHAPLGGIQYLIAGYQKTKEGVLSRGKVIYKPKTLREKVVTGTGLTTFELGEKYRRLFGEKKKKESQPKHPPSPRSMMQRMRARALETQ